MLVQSLPSQTSLAVPTPDTPIIDMIVALPETQNVFHVAMAQLLPYFVYSSSTEYIVPQITRVSIRGTAMPGSTVVVLVNNVDQYPTTSIVVDQAGAWSTAVVLSPGQSLIRAQYQ